MIKFFNWIRRLFPLWTIQQRRIVDKVRDGSGPEPPTHYNCRCILDERRRVDLIIGDEAKLIPDEIKDMLFGSEFKRAIDDYTRNNNPEERPEK